MSLRKRAVAWLAADGPEDVGWRLLYGAGLILGTGCLGGLVIGFVVASLVALWLVSPFLAFGVVVACVALALFLVGLIREARR